MHDKTHSMPVEMVFIFQFSKSVHRQLTLFPVRIIVTVARVTASWLCLLITAHLRVIMSSYLKLLIRCLVFASQKPGLDIPAAKVDYSLGVQSAWSLPQVEPRHPYSRKRPHGYIYKAVTVGNLWSEALLHLPNLANHFRRTKRVIRLRIEYTAQTTLLAA